MKLISLSDIGIAICALIATVGSIIIGLLGGWDSLAIVFISFIIIDYITGVLVAIYEKKLNSEIGLKGITKKVMMIILVIVVVLLSQIVQIEGLRSLTMLLFIANEGISILENAGKLGVPYPSILKKTLEKLKENKEE